MAKKLLVVEDDAPIREVLSNAFEKAGFEVLVSTSAEEALQLLNDERIPVFFLDLLLPGIDGVELCRRIRKDNPDAAIYAMTGYTNMFSRAECFKAGFDDYFGKPFVISELIKAADKPYATGKSLPVEPLAAAASPPPSPA